MADFTTGELLQGTSPNVATSISNAAATALLSAVVGDSGSGGTKGLVPAPASGDAAAGKFLKADGTWDEPSIFSSNASDLTTGTIDDARLSANVPVMAAGVLPAANGSLLTSLNASNLASGTVDSSRLPPELAYTNTENSWDGISKFNSCISLSYDTPATLTGNVNNYDPESAGEFLPICRLSSDASRDITGIAQSNPESSKKPFVLLINVGTQNIILKHENASSSATNRFLCSTGADVTLAANQAAYIFYDRGLASARWRVLKFS